STSLAKFTLQYLGRMAPLKLGLFRTPRSSMRSAAAFSDADIDASRPTFSEYLNIFSSASLRVLPIGAPALRMISNFVVYLGWNLLDPKNSFALKLMFSSELRR